MQFTEFIYVAYTDTTLWVTLIDEVWNINRIASHLAEILKNVKSLKDSGSICYKHFIK